MFKENRIVFKEEAPKKGVEAQNVEVDADLKAIELERFVSRKGELLEKAQRILHKEGATSATKIDELKVLHTGLTKYYDKNKSIKCKGTEADKGRVNAALLEISKVMDEINAEILKLEEPAREEVKTGARDDLRALKAEVRKPGSVEFKYANIPEEKRLKVSDYSNLIAQKFAEKGYPATTQITIGQDMHRDGYYKQIAIDVGNKTLSYAVDQSKGEANYDKLLRTALDNLPEANMHTFQEYKEAMDKVKKFPKEIDTPFNRQLLAYILQKNGYKPDTRIEIEYESIEGNEAYKIRIVLNDNEKIYEGTGYVMSSAFNKALMDLNLNDKPYLAAESFNNPEYSTSVEMSHSRYENGKDEADNSFDKSVEKDIQAKVLREMSRKGYPKLSFVNIRTVEDGVAHFVLIKINATEWEKGWGNTWETATREALNGIREYKEEM
ncbi:MAG: hypothetical protein WCT36_02320 [Candidatus Gracilibacteria bacterium]|jgi:hypothetical protein